MVSFTALWHAQPEVFAQTAQRWDVFGAALDAQHGEMTRITTAVGAGWEGSARDAAMTYLGGIAERIERDRALVEQIPPMFTEHCTTVQSAQQQLRATVAATVGTPILVDPDGSVRIPPQVAAVVVALGGPVAMAMLIVHAETINAAISAALRVATESDEHTTDRLAQLTPPSGAQPGDTGPGATRIPPAGTSPQRVAQWWAGLSGAEQVALIYAHPEQIGNLDGIPAEVRDETNQLRLPGERAALRAQATQLQAAVVAGDRSAAAQLGQVRDKLRALDVIDSTLARGDRQLLLLDTSGRRVKAAVAIGNVDTAHHVTVFTPGFTSTVEGSLAGYDDEMRMLRLQAQDQSVTSGDGGSVAAVTWIGYEAPQWGEITDPSRSVAGEHQARAGGAALAGFLDGIDAARPDDPHLTAIGHSYGSTTTGYAVQHTAAVDDAIFFGSPGIATSHVQDLHVAAGHSYVIEARDDPVADLGRFGADPNQLRGLTDLSSSAARTPDGHQLTEVTGHTNYLAPDSTSQYNIGAVVAGMPNRAFYGENTGLGDGAREFVDDAGDAVGGAIRKVRDIAPGF